ncbi:GNAT family N-acetyltransferase [Nonomuraea phyllanthi]|uniref:GNAT family N-acetyltransferase n=1 Tax=Nonomuraea phyllanthi TaxID=2219224 RepID=A0A5C4WL06_9ACTN|nr:GNAT family N-acetyltransferase [Nonomuraea phyllanthi]KAB8194735.1 GNAT family N-acetyltransferase [Nonomuraea phyllanthi]
MSDLIKDHAARVRSAEPLLAGQDDLPAKGELLEAPDAVARAVVDRLDPDGLQACWSPLTVHHLRARVAGSDPEAALGALLDQWLARPRPAGPEQALSVWWPSRDTEPVRALAVRGFAPVTVVAARRLRPGTAVTSGFTAGSAAGPAAVRAAGADDLEVMARMYERLVAYDAQFGWVTVRGRTGELLRAYLSEEALPLEWCWLAELDGRAAGFAVVQPPARSGWISGGVNDAPVAYLGAMYVEPRARGLGVGPALTETAHRRAGAAGVSTMVLHHALPNPLSAPFWNRRGYRPLLTQWVRHLR